MMGGVLVLLYLLGLHTEYGIPRVPCTFVLCGASGLLMLWRWRHRVLRSQFYSLAGVNLVAMGTVILSPEAPRLWIEGVKAWLQLSYSLTASYGLYLELSTWRPATLGRCAAWGILLCLAGFALEIECRPFRAVSDAFRNAITDGSVFLYGQGESGGGAWSVERDLALAGHLRPSFFAREPSHAAYTLVLLLTTWYGLTTARHKILLYMAALALAFKLTGSPTMLGAAVAFVATWLDDLLTPGSSVRRAPGLSLVLALLLLPIGVAAVTLFGSRFSPKKADLSSCLRTVLPYQIAWRTLGEHPAFGIGLNEIETYEDVLWREAVNLAAERGLARDVVENGNLISLLCNSFCEIPIYFGLVGGLALFYHIRNVIRYFGVGRYCYTICIMVALMNTFGGMVSARSWSSLMLILAVASARHRRSAETL